MVVKVKINIIGDIAGRYDELLLLLEKMPEADLTIAVGDLVDRGPKSKQVIEYFMKTPKTLALYGNHEDLMFQAVMHGQHNDMYLWKMNGGEATLKSYEDEAEYADIPAHVLDWLMGLPMYYETDNLFISHAPVTGLDRGLYPKDPYSRDHRFFWNRWPPSKPQKKYMVYGHNAVYRLHKWGDGTEFATCIDNSAAGELRGMHWPTREIFTQEYLDNDLG